MLKEEEGDIRIQHIHPNHSNQGSCQGIQAAIGQADAIQQNHQDVLPRHSDCQSPLHQAGIPQGTQHRHDLTQPR